MKKFIKKVSLVKGRLYLSLCFILALYNLSGQYYQGNNFPYDISDSLPHNEINEIVKDKSGFVWTASENVHSRYDGYDFFNFNNATHPSIFKDNRIKSIRLGVQWMFNKRKSTSLSEVLSSEMTHQRFLFNLYRGYIF